MNVTNAQFVTSAADPRGYPELSLPEVAFVGRSNVGKSSLLNTLMRRKGLVKTSSTPGKTQLINFFEIQVAQRPYHLVDLPGYGYAKVPETERRRWQERIETYLTERDTLRLVVVLVDIRHPPSEKDHQMVQWLDHVGRDLLVVATKSDKLSRSKVQQSCARIRKVMGRPVMAVSSPKKEGIPPLWKTVLEALTAP